MLGSHFFTYHCSGFAFIACYFVVSVAVRKFALKKSGADIIPHVSFWADFPFLLKDGIMLPIDLVQQMRKRGPYAELSDPVL